MINDKQRRLAKSKAARTAFLYQNTKFEDNSSVFAGSHFSFRCKKQEQRPQGKKLGDGISEKDSDDVIFSGDEEKPKQKGGKKSLKNQKEEEIKKEEERKELERIRQMVSKFNTSEPKKENLSMRKKITFY